MGLSKLASGIAFLVDSDITISDGWFAGLASAFDDPAIQIAFGNVRLETGTFIEKSFALAMQAFPLDVGSRGIDSVDSFLANNVALRRKACGPELFPNGEAYRGHCKVASNKILSAGGRIFRVNAARGLHPAPNGLRHFMLQALVDGRDEVILTRLGARKKWKAGPLGSLVRLLRSVGEALLRILTKGGPIGLHPLQVVPAWGVAVAYYGLRFLGELATQIDPRIVRNSGMH